MAIQKREDRMQIAYYDPDKNEMCLRDATEEEATAIQSTSSGINFEMKNADILSQLEEIDRKTIRPLSEGEMERVATLRAQAAVLRAKLVK